MSYTTENIDIILIHLRKIYLMLIINEVKLKCIVIKRKLQLI